jgi:hypothetical protein
MMMMLLMLMLLMLLMLLISPLPQWLRAWQGRDFGLGAKKGLPLRRQELGGKRAANQE